MILQREIEAFCKTKPKSPLFSAAATVLKFECAQPESTHQPCAKAVELIRESTL
jgi:hypothetical protein